MSDQDLAQLIAAATIGLFIRLLMGTGRRVWIVVTDRVTYTPHRGTPRTLLKGARIPATEVSAAQQVDAESVHAVHKSALSAIVVGKDDRTSTSKTVVFAWTLAIAFGLISLVIAKWLGDSTGWDAQVGNGIQEEYLLLLGGPFAAAVLAKRNALTQPGSQGKTPAAFGAGNATQLVTDDQGDADLGDFQYVLFNLIALGFFLGDFIGNLDHGFPQLPPLLTGLVLTSAGGYSAKKLIQEARPTLTSVVPAGAVRGAAGIQIYGLNLLIGASVSPTGTVMAPLVSIGGNPATITASDQILGADRLTVTVDPSAAAGAGTITVVRADGVPAVGPAGSDGIPFTIA
ncbi:MAG: hypothetical protein M3Z33_06805 [Actinomycetota bacterium]|nr:hypothetical protein [Actinomycetota bacterium]